MMIEAFRNANLIETIIIFILSILFYIMYQTYQRKTCKMASNKTVIPSFVYNMDCPICFNILKVAIVADCKHAYCVDCLHAFSMKNSWNNLCPLCRQLLKNLKILENENCRYSEAMKQKLQRKIAEISKSSKLNVSDLVTSQTTCKIFCGTVSLLLWTWAVVNIDNLFYYFGFFSAYFQNSSQ